MAAYDFKKAYKDLYQPKSTPSRIVVPEMTFIAISGQGNPTDKAGEYPDALSVLYALCYTIKMSKMGAFDVTGYYDYVVPPLEGFWWMNGIDGIDYSHKEGFNWISLIRQPEFVTDEVFEWAKAEASRKKKLDTTKAKLVRIEEGLCVQCMHIGAFDDEPATLEKIDAFIEADGLTRDITDSRRHHEIYLGDPRKGDIDKHKTILRIPVKERAR